MPRPAKDTRPCSLRMEKQLFERLEQFCTDSGQSKTTAIERAVSMYIDDYYKKMRRAEETT